MGSSETRGTPYYTPRYYRIPKKGNPKGVPRFLGNPQTSERFAVLRPSPRCPEEVETFGVTLLGVPYWGPYYKGILLFRGLLFRKPHLWIAPCYEQHGSSLDLRPKAKPETLTDALNPKPICPARKSQGTTWDSIYLQFNSNCP